MSVISLTITTASNFFDGLVNGLKLQFSGWLGLKYFLVFFCFCFCCFFIHSCCAYIKAERDFFTTKRRAFTRSERTVRVMWNISDIISSRMTKVRQQNPFTSKTLLANRERESRRRN